MIPYPAPESNSFTALIPHSRAGIEFSVSGH